MPLASSRQRCFRRACHFCRSPHLDMYITVGSSYWDYGIYPGIKRIRWPFRPSLQRPQQQGIARWNMDPLIPYGRKLAICLALFLPSVVAIHLSNFPGQDFVEERKKRIQGMDLSFPPLMRFFLERGKEISWDFVPAVFKFLLLQASQYVWRGVALCFMMIGGRGRGGGACEIVAHAAKVLVRVESYTWRLIGIVGVEDTR